ncbi:MAG: MFS transporter [Nitrospiraceae bacterium]|nr:MFS transporter [Nitrospiraceae bacterium]
MSAREPEEGPLPDELLAAEEAEEARERSRTGQLRIVYAARALVSASRAIAGIGGPIYLAKVGFGGTGLGIVFALAGVFALFVSFGVGFMADRMGRRIFLVVYPMLVAAAGFVFAFSRAEWVLGGMAVVASFGRGAGAGAGSVGPYQPAETAMVADLARAGRRNQAFIAIAQMSVIGAIAGSVIAFFAFPAASGGKGGAFTAAFVVAGVLALLGGFVALWLENDRRPRGQKPPKGVFPHRSLGLLARLWVTNTLNGLAVGMFGPFVTYFLYLKFHASPAQIALLYLVVNVVSLGPIGQVGKLAERFGTIRVTVFFRLIQALLLVPFAFAPTFLMAGILYLVRMIAQRLAMPLRQSYVQARVPPEERARVAALANLPSQGAMAASPALSGYLFDVAPLEVPFMIGGVLQLVSTLFYWGFFSKSPPPEETARD